jgi:hypothetical protein
MVGPLLLFDDYDVAAFCVAAVSCSVFCMCSTDGARACVCACACCVITGGCPVVIVPGSQSQLLSVDTHPGTHVFVTGSASGIVSMWDCTANKKVCVGGGASVH